MDLKKRFKNMWQSLYWARQYHEIVKYPPENYDKNGIYTRDEWTDYSCIGLEINGSILTEDEYLKVENSYIQCAKEIMLKSGCSYLTIARIHKYRQSIRELVKFKYRTRVYPCDLDILLQKTLRGQIGCHMVNLKRKYGVYIGDDYYMHVRSPLDWDTLNGIVSSHGLYLDPRSNKYDYLREYKDM